MKSFINLIFLEEGYEMSLILPICAMAQEWGDVERPHPSSKDKVKLPIIHYSLIFARHQ
jgi:hypothetical protein